MILALSRPSRSSSRLQKTILPCRRLASTSEVVASSTPSFRKSLNDFRVALFNKDFENVWSSYADLAGQNYLERVGLRQYESLASYIATVASQKDLFNSERTPRLEQLATSAAAHGAYSGVVQYSILLLGNSEPQKVLRLYETVRENTQEIKSGAEPPSPHSIEESTASNKSDPQWHSLPVDWVLSGESNNNSQYSYNASAGSSAEFQLCAIAASAMLDSFALALKIALASPLRLHSVSATAFFNTEPLRSVGEDYKSRAIEYVRDLETATIVAKPSALARHIQNMVDDGNIASLQGFWQKIVQSIHSPRARIVVHSDSAEGTVRISEDLWTTFLSAFTQLGRQDYAKEVWKTFTHLQLQPTAAMWNALFQTCCRDGFSPEANALWIKMSKLSVTPTAASYSALIAALWKSKEKIKALAVFRDLFSSCDESQRHLIRPLCDDEVRRRFADKRTDDAFKLLQEMTARGPKPTKETYNVILNHQRKTRDLKGMGQTLQAMSRAGVVPDIASFTMLLDSLLTAKRMGVVHELFRLMSIYGYDTNVAMLTNLMRHLIERGDREGLSAASDMLLLMETSKDVSTRPNEVTYTQLMNALVDCKDLKPEESGSAVEELADRMQRLKVRPNRMTFEVLIRSALGNGDISLAMRHFRSQKSARLPFTFFIFDVLLGQLLQLQDNTNAMLVIMEIDKTKYLIPSSLRGDVAKIRSMYSTKS